MDLVVSTDHAGIGAQGLATALRWLAGTPVAAGGVTCLGLRLVDFPDAAWGSALCWLAQSPAAAVSADERARSARFVHPADAVRHLLGRSLLRQVFAHHSDACAPAVWPLNPWGKPQGGGWNMHFNLSHAGAEVWIALSDAGPVGIDVEFATPLAGDLLPVVHPLEADDLRHDGSAARCRRLWVRKEAVVKATGEGLSLPLDVFRVLSDERDKGWLVEPPMAYAGPWTTCDLPDQHASVVAIAARGRDLPVTWRLAKVLLTP